MTWKTAVFIIYIRSTICYLLLCAHILTSRPAHHHYHMFKQQVPYVPPLPLALRAPKDHILLSHTHHHPGLTDHSQTDGPWLLLGLCLRWPVGMLLDQRVHRSRFVKCSACLVFIVQFTTAFEPLFSLPSCLRESQSGSLFPFPIPFLLVFSAGKVSPPADRTCGPLRPQALR